MVLKSGRNQGGGGKLSLASFLFGHNLKVGILAAGLGILAAIPTVLLIIVNGMILGSFASDSSSSWHNDRVWA